MTDEETILSLARALREAHVKAYALLEKCFDRTTPGRSVYLHASPEAAAYRVARNAVDDAEYALTNYLEGP